MSNSGSPSELRSPVNASDAPNPSPGVSPVNWTINAPVAPSHTSTIPALFAIHGVAITESAMPSPDKSRLFRTTFVAPDCAAKQSACAASVAAQIKINSEELTATATADRHRERFNGLTERSVFMMFPFEMWPQPETPMRLSRYFVGGGGAMSSCTSTHIGNTSYRAHG